MEKIKKLVWMAAVVLFIGIVVWAFYYSRQDKVEEEEQVPNGVHGHFSGTVLEIADEYFYVEPNEEWAWNKVSKVKLPFDGRVAKTDPSKWKVGDGVSVVFNETSMEWREDEVQINIIFAIYEWPEKEEAEKASMELNTTESTATGNDKSLYEQGLELIDLMKEMVGNDVYMSLYSSSTELQEIISPVAEGDYSVPREVYKITIDEKLLLSLGGEVNLDGMSEQLQDYMCSRLYASIATQLNARLGGANVLAAASICTASKTFVNSELTKNLICLYTYEDAKPVIITFIPGEDNTVSASGYFILCEEPGTDILEKLKEYLDVFAGTIEVVEEIPKN